MFRCLNSSQTFLEPSSLLRVRIGFGFPCNHPFNGVFPLDKIRFYLFHGGTQGRSFV